MNETRLVSFLEFDHQTGALGLGAGPSWAVIRRSHAAPFLQVCCLEPQGEEVRFRARLGSANMAADGIQWIEQPDPMLHRGAWIRVIPLCCGLGPFFERFVPELLADMETDEPQALWLGFEARRSVRPLWRVTEDEVATMLSATTGLGGATAIRIAGTRQQAEEIAQAVIGMGKNAPIE